MEQPYHWPWVQARVAETMAAWNGSAWRTPQPVRRYGPGEQQQKERALEAALRAVERDAKRSTRSRAAQIESQNRIAASVARVTSMALDFDPEAVDGLIADFLPVGTQLAHWARRLDPAISMADIMQACRNAWIAAAMQSLLGERVQITPSILAYSLIYPYSDNFLDRDDLPPPAKLRFSARFRERLLGERLSPSYDPEATLWLLVEWIEQQYPRPRYPQVYDCLLAIHRAQEESIRQHRSCDCAGEAEVLSISCAKGGTSVLADACLAHPWLTDTESRFAFEWGVLLQLGDDLQDIHDDMRRGSVTVFSHAAGLGKPLDGLVTQLLSFSDQVGLQMDKLPHGSQEMKQIFKASWRSLVIASVAEADEFFSAEFIRETERCSPFRFDFLRSQQRSWGGRKRLHTLLLEAFISGSGEIGDKLSLPDRQQEIETGPDRLSTLAVADDAPSRVSSGHWLHELQSNILSKFSPPDMGSASNPSARTFWESGNRFAVARPGQDPHFDNEIERN